MWYGASRNPTTLIRDLDRDILPPFHHDHLDRRILIIIVNAVSLYHSTQRVFEEFKTDVRKMTWDIRECEVGWADELDIGGFEEGIMFFTDVAGVI